MPSGLLFTLAAFLICFTPAIIELVTAWFKVPDAEHGILIAPIAIWMAWTKGVVRHPTSVRLPGVFFIVTAILMYIVGKSGGAATLPRLAILIALIGVVLWHFGYQQVVRWWLPFALLCLTIPVPESVIDSISTPLQGLAAGLGAEMLSWRGIPVALTGNIIHIPGHMLFVSEACSGLRSLTALFSMAILIGALFLKHILSRILILGFAVGVAIFINGIRVFLTGFLVYFVDPALGEGFMHFTEGYLLFLVSLLILGALSWCGMNIEERFFPEDSRSL